VSKKEKPVLGPENQGQGKKSKFNLKLYFLSTLLFVAIGGVAVGAFSAVKSGIDFVYKPQFEDKNDVVKAENLATETPKSEGMKGRLNILLVGTDLGGVHTDTIMVASYDMDHKKVDILSIPRDTRVKVNGKYRKINSANAIGGMDMLLETLKDSFGIGINYYVKINYKGFVEVVDALGGVDFDVPREMNYDDPVQDLHIHLKKGMQHLDGKQAEGLVRWRHNNDFSSGYAEGDVGRIKTQQEFIKAFIEQKLNLSNLDKAGELYGILVENVKTNMTIKNVLDLVPNLKELPSDGITTYQLPGEGEYVGDVSYFLYDGEEAERMLKEDIGLENCKVVPCDIK
jgi:LCP family protein required for cell wall assembly